MSIPEKVTNKDTGFKLHDVGKRGVISNESMVEQYERLVASWKQGSRNV